MPYIPVVSSRKMESRGGNGVRLKNNTQNKNSRQTAKGKMPCNGRELLYSIYDIRKAEQMLRSAAIGSVPHGRISK